jgi:hypothetical protein
MGPYIVGSNGIIFKVLKDYNFSQKKPFEVYKENSIV